MKNRIFHTTICAITKLPDFEKGMDINMNEKNVTASLLGTVIHLVILGVIIVFVFKMATAAYDFGFRVFAEQPVSNPPGLDINVAVTDDMSTMDIGKMLENQGLIEDAKLFFVQEKVSEYKGQIKPGTYTLNTSMTVEEMIAIMAASSDEEGSEDISGNSENALEETDTPSEFSTEEMSSEVIFEE